MTFIGSKISLISNSKIRYEGTLYTIDPQGSTIALQNVRCMGTEDRRGEKAIKASDTIYEFMIFNGENIKNLELIEEAPNEFNDPAVLEAKVASSDKQGQDTYQQQLGWTGQYNQGGYYDGGGRTHNWTGGRRGRGGGLNRRYGNRGGYTGNNWKRLGVNDSQNIGRGGVVSNTRPTKVNARRKGGKNSNRTANKTNEKKDSPGTGKFLERQTKNNDDADLEIKDKEFDFQGNLARFDMSSMKKELVDENKGDKDDDKTENAKEASEDKEADEDEAKKEVEESEKDEKPPAYQHDNFFDTLSTDRETYKRPSVTEMRDLDAETFGKIGSTYRCKTRWFRRWRGNFRGRGAFRGGYNQRDAN